MDVEDQARLLAKFEKEKADQQGVAKEVVEQELTKKVIEEDQPLEEVNVEEKARLLAEFEKKTAEKDPSKEVAEGVQKRAPIRIKLLPKRC